MIANTIINRIIVSGLLSVFYISQALADDVEIYQGKAIGVRQNTVFAIDTSRSMSKWEEEAPTYDPQVRYPSQDGFDPDLYYYSTSDNSQDFTAEAKKRYFHPDALVCQNAKARVEKYGTLRDNFLRRDPNRQVWETPSSGTGLGLGTIQTNAWLECESDAGYHPSNYYVNPRQSNYAYVSYRNLNRRMYSRLWRNPIRRIFSGNYLNYQRTLGDSSNSGERATRISLTQDAVKHVINTINGIRIGLMRFSSNNEGGFVDVAVDNIENIRSQIVTQVDSYFAWGGTPLSETYYEAAMYLKGQAVGFGRDSRSVVKENDDVVLQRNSTHGMVEGPTSELKSIPTPSVDPSRTSAGSSYYKSPITNSCQSDSSIILFTDGAPSVDESSNAAIRDLIKNIDFPNDPDAELQLSKDCSGNGGCADELAYYLFNYDQNPDLPGIQRIRTHVVGGFLDDTDPDSVAGEKLMKSIAKHGAGKYLAADSYETLVKALEATVGSVADTPATFVAPAISANSYNSLEHLDELYYAMFEPSGSAKWRGNLKSYRLSGDGTIRDSKGDKAVNSDGLFDPSSRSYWTDPAIRDGEKITLGGAASLLIAKDKIFTHLASTTDAPLTDTLTTTSISKDMLGIPSDSTSAEHEAVINWGNRVDELDPNASRREMEDPLHSRPVVINYKSEKDSSGKIIHDSAVFVATNSGFLHAFKADKNNFENYFSYIPKELLPNLAAYKNGATVADKVYGLDGPITYWHQDKNQDAIVDADEKVFLYVGMRRGGRNYYALDVSDPKQPKFAWQITGNSGAFSNLGQTWSAMTLAKVPWRGAEKIVLFFGGGYDPIEDERTSFAAHNSGNSIYMVDALTGELLWQASNRDADLNIADMESSFVADIRTVDFNGDQISDYLYASDVGGKIWRIDINKSTTGANDFAQAGVIFDANGDPNSNYQRFYYSPSISYQAQKGQAHLTLSIGSGYRAHPLENTPADSFYIIKDYNITASPESYTTVTPKLLATIGTESSDQEIHRGWKMLLEGQSEKVLAKALTTNDSVYFTTFEPASEATSPGQCNGGAGIGRGYQIKLPKNPKEPPEVLPPTIFEPEVPPPSPEVFLTTTTGDKEFCAENPSHESCNQEPTDKCETAGAIVLSGTESIGEGISRCALLKKTFWREN